MTVESRRWTPGGGWDCRPGELTAAQLVLVFASSSRCAIAELSAEMSAAWPRAELAGCSTAGKISDTPVTADDAGVAAIELSDTSSSGWKRGARGSVRAVGPRTVLAGFYSSGEIAPFTPSARCQPANQTMTITTLGER
jgi:hypothetical protein